MAQAARTLNVVAFTPGATNPAGDPEGLALDLGIETALAITDAVAASRG